MLNVGLGDPAVCAVTPGCVPINIIGEGSLTQEMLDFVTYTGVDTSSQKLVDVTANLSGDLFDLPAGPLAFAVGYEHREEDGSFVPDPVVAAGETADVPTNPTAGGIDLDEFYGEVVVPIVKDVTAIDSLSFSAAARYSDSDLFDSETGSKFAVNWGPVENLMLRASYSEGFRSPNIGELFNLGSRFDSSISDPCNTDLNPIPPANCAALGVPDGYVQLNPQVSVDTGGNRELEPETSETFTAGLTWSMPLSGALEGLLVEANYYDITIDGAIQAPDAQDTLDACVATLDPLFCNQVNRNPSGTITSIEGTLNNIGGIETKGVDINLDLTTAESGIGSFRFQLMGSFLLDYDELFANSTGGFDRVERAGQELGSPTRGFVEEKVTLNTYWNVQEFSTLLSLRYLSSLTEQCVGLVADFGQTDFCSNPAGGTNQLDSQLYVDLQVAWAPEDLFGGGWSFAAGVQNLTDEEPPVCFSCDLNSLDGTIYPIASPFWYRPGAVQELMPAAPEWRRKAPERGLFFGPDKTGVPSAGTMAPALTVRRVSREACMELAADGRENAFTPTVWLDRALTREQSQQHGDALLAYYRAIIEAQRQGHGSTRVHATALLGRVVAMRYVKAGRPALLRHALGPVYALHGREALARFEECLAIQVETSR